MPTAENGVLYYEAGQTPAGIVQLSDSGDHTIFNSAAQLWSKYSGKVPVVRPNGLATGGVVIPAVAAGNDAVDVTALTAYLAGVLESVGAAADQAITRGSALACKISSITVTSAAAIAVVAGTEGAAFSETRGAAGGPPLIPVDSIEIAQVRLDSLTPAPVEADEIYQIVGHSMERWDYPTWKTNPYNVDSDLLGYAGIEFVSVLGLIHTGSVPKQIWANYYTPTFAELTNCDAFVRPGEGISVSSKQVYSGVLGAMSKSLNQGSFTVYLNGVDDPFLKEEGNILFFKFKTDRLVTPYVLCQGYLGITESFPAADAISAACVIAAESAGVRVIA